MSNCVREIDNECGSYKMNHPNSEKALKDMSNRAGTQLFSAIEFHEDQLQARKVKGISCLCYGTFNQLCRLCREILPLTFLRKIGAEIISTFILVSVTCGSSILSHSSPALVSKLGCSIASGLIVTVMIYSVGHISGAHMNPAVTVAFATVRRFPWNQVPAYIAAELGGALAASFTLRLMFEQATTAGTTSPSGTACQALAMEIIVSFVLMFVTSAVATDSRAISELAGIAVGSTVMISSIFAGPISGGSMNPARSIGPAVASNKYEEIWVYIIGPMAGTIMGAWSYSLIRLPDTPLNAISSGSSSSFSSFSDVQKDVQGPKSSLSNNL